MASDENWERAHKRAAPFFLLESIIWFDSALLLVITAAFDAPELSRIIPLVILLAMFAVTFIWMLIAVHRSVGIHGGRSEHGE